MGILDVVKGLFGGGRGHADDGLYYYVQCGRCKEIVQVRVNRANELRQLFEESDGVAGFACRKVVVDAKCFRPIEINLHFTSTRQEKSREIEGGTFVDRAAYEDAHPSGGSTSG